MNTNLLKRGSFDTAILGMWWGWNYGALLTSFALYRFLQQLGYQPIMLDHSIMSETWEHCSANDTPFRLFLSEQKITTYPVPTVKIAEKITTQISTFVVGSDQLWRYEYIREFGTQFFLDFVPNGKRKISYATSLGNEGAEVPEDFKRAASELLAHFDAISVREFSGIRELKRLYNVNSEQVLDPVFLLNREYWLDIAKPNEVLPNKPFLLSYILDNSDNMQRLLSQLKSRFPNHCIVPDYSSIPNDNFATLGRVLKKIDIPTWLYAIATCDYFVTDSFHGACFAIIFNKPFICVMNSKRGKSRFHTLQKLFPDLINCFIEEVPNEFSDQYFKSNYLATNIIIKEYAAKSLLWLQYAMSIPPKQHDIRVSRVRPIQKPSKIRKFLYQIKQNIIHAIKPNKYKKKIFD